MTADSRDVQRAVAIINYCDEIAGHLKKYQMTPDSFETTRLYQLAINRDPLA